MTYFARKPVQQEGLSGMRQWLRTLTTTSLVQDTGDKRPFLCFLLEGRLEAGRLTGAWNPAREPTVQSLSVLKLAHSFNDGEGKERKCFHQSLCPYLIYTDSPKHPFRRPHIPFYSVIIRIPLTSTYLSSSALVSPFLPTLSWFSIYLDDMRRG